MTSDTDSTSTSRLRNVALYLLPLAAAVAGALAWSHLAQVGTHAEELTSLPAGVVLHGSVQYGADLAEPTLLFQAHSGPTYIKRCAGEKSTGCYTVQIQAALSHSAEVDVIEDVTLRSFSAGPNKTVYVFTRAQHETEPFLSLSSS